MINWIKEMIEKHPTLWEIFKFVLVGGSATLVDFFIMGVVLYVWDPVLYGNSFMNAFIGGAEPTMWAAIVGTSAGFTAGLIINYILSVGFVFTGKDNTTVKAKTKKGFMLFTIFAVIGLFIHIIGMYLGNGVLNINEWIVKILLTFVVLVFNYVTRKKFIFNKNEAEEKVA